MIPAHHERQRIKSQAIGEFLDWLRGERQTLLASRHEHEAGCYCSCTNTLECHCSPLELTCGHYQGELQVDFTSIEDLLREFFEVDEEVET